MFSYIQERGVQHLVHFTRANNVPSILRHGLLSRDELEARGISHCINDPYRFDYLTNAVCLSISFPNYKLFYRLRQENPEEDWVVLRLRPELLDEKRCAFSYSNAAAREIAHVSVESRMTIAALEGMFSDHEGMPHRATLKIPHYFATNPQAEILVLDPIEPIYITDVIVDSKDRIRNMSTILSLAKEHNGIAKFLHGKTLFDARADYAHWRKAPHG